MIYFEKKNTKKKFTFRDVYETLCHTVSQDPELKKLLKSGSWYTIMLFVDHVHTQKSKSLDELKFGEIVLKRNERIWEFLRIQYCPDQNEFYDKRGYKKDYGPELEKVYSTEMLEPSIGSYGESFYLHPTHTQIWFSLQFIVYEEVIGENGNFQLIPAYEIQVFDLIKEGKDLKVTKKTNGG